MDQATTLRKIIDHNKDSLPQGRQGSGKMRVIAVTSGKGGVGKTNIVVNLCLALSRLGKKVFLLDADMGLANVDVLLGQTPKYTLEHVMKGQKKIQDIVLTGPEGFKILPSGSGISELSEMTFEQQMQLFRELSKIDDDIDYLFIDTGAGISSNVLRFNASANEVLIVANSEPTSITDAYALMKLLSIKYHIRNFGLIANSVGSGNDGKAVFETLERVCDQFIKVNLIYLGWIPFDSAIRKSVRRQRLLLDIYPKAEASKKITEIAKFLDQNPIQKSTGQSTAKPTEPTSSSQKKPESFWDRLLHWKKV